MAALAADPTRRFDHGKVCWAPYRLPPRRGSAVDWPPTPRQRARSFACPLTGGVMREESSMLEIGLFHNGASSLPVITSRDGVTFNKGSLADVHRAAQETLVNQVRQGILAEKLGFQSFWLTEHHFQPEGAE